MLKFACPTIAESCKQMNLMFAPQLFFEMIRHLFQHHFHLFSPLILQFNIYIVLHCISKYTNICYIMHIFMCLDGLGNMAFFFFFYVFVWISFNARGKFGTVYKCQEKSTGLRLAAKFIPIPKRDDRRNVEREVEIMNSLQHPLIIQLYDAYEYSKMMCVVLEL